MALEFNADKERIVSSNLQIKNDTTAKVTIGGSADEKTAIFAKQTDVGGDKLIRVGINTENPLFELDVDGQIRTTTSIISDTARINNLDIDTIVNPQLKLKAPDLVTFTDPDTGQTFFPNSVTPSFRDDSTKVATTNFVYNIATNDVGGRIYVSEQIGDDTFDGRSATKPVKTIKRGAQLASITDQKETLIVAGGEYLEDNPISLPTKCSVVGDNIRLVICRPRNAGKNMFKAASENYVFGLTFRDQIDSNGNALDTWNFAYVFDDKQRIYYDKNLGGTTGRNFEVGYQYFGAPKFEVVFSENSAVTGLEVGKTVSSSSGGSATITEVNFNEGTNLSGSFVLEDVTGAILRADTITYDDNGNPATLIADRVNSQRIEVEVVKHVTSHTLYSVLSVEASDVYPDGLIFEVDQYHDYEVGQYVDIDGFASSGLYGDLARFNGRQKISHRIETEDGFSKKFVVYKDTPTDITGLSGGSSTYTPPAVTLESSDNYVIATLLNSPFKFSSTETNSFRYQDAVDLIQRNKEYVTEEALGRVQAEFPNTSFDATKCKRDLKTIIDHVSHDLFYGGNAASVEAGEKYLLGGAVSYVDGELEETKYAIREARELSIEALRNILAAGTYTSISPYTDNTIIVDPTQAVSQKAGDAYRLIQNNKNFIAHEAFYLMTQQFPSWTPPNGTANQDCIDDILSNLDEITYDLLYGGNSKTYDAGNVYITNTLNGVTYSRTIEDGERDESVFAYNKARDLAVDIISNNIITVQGSHGFIQFRDTTITIDAVEIGQFTPTDATYDPATGDFVITFGSAHGLTTSNAIGLDRESFVFTCDMDGNKTEHALPGPGQIAYSSNLEITNTTTNTLTINVGASGGDQTFTPTAAVYSPSAGTLLLTIGAHTLSIGEGVVIDDNSLSFTCDMDNNQSTKTYPRPGIDPFAGRSIPIAAVSADTITLNVGTSAPNQYFTPTTASYDAATGDLTLSIGQHGLGAGRGIVLEDESISFTCADDGNQSVNAYPRPSDPASGQSLTITDVAVSQHTATDAPYSAGSGIVTLTVAGHGFNDGDYVKISDGSLTYTCDLDGNTVQKSYPRAGYDYPSGRWLSIFNVTSNTFQINVGDSSYTGAHAFVSAATNGIERQTGNITVNVGASPVGQQYTHQFVSATNNAVKHEPQSEHTFIGATAGSVKHLPQSTHAFVRVSNNAVTAYQSYLTCQTEAGTINTLFGILTQAIGDDTNGVGNLTAITRTEPIVSTTFGDGACANVVSTVYTLFDIVLDILDGELSPTRTLPSSAFTDVDGNVVAVRDPWDDLPIIEVSPYIFNSSVISFIGGGGCEVDGTKVATPNVPRPNLPEQGKSMVAAAFTIISFGGIGYKVIKDGYTQLVSCFVIFCQDGIFADTGGYASVTNSATNFGTYALRAQGYRDEAYSFHEGTIDNITFDEVGRPIFTVVGLGGRPLEHYVMKVGGVENHIQGVSGGGEYLINKVLASTASAPFTVELEIDGAPDVNTGVSPVMRITGNNNRYTDAYNLLFNNGIYIGDESVGIAQNLSTLSLGLYDPVVTFPDAGDIVENISGDYYICVKPDGDTSEPPITDTDYFQFVASSGTTLTFQPDIEKCRRDTRLTVQSWAKDLLQDSNSNTWDAAKLYVDAVNGGVIHIGGYEESTKAVFRVASALSRFAINNLLRKSTYTSTPAEFADQTINPYIAQYTVETPYRDETITNSNDDGDATGTDYSYADCVDVIASINTLYALTEEILNETEVTAGLTRNDGIFNLTVLNRDKLIDKIVKFHRPSIVNSSSHTWEYAGSGNDYNALPQNGGQSGSIATKDFEQVSQLYGRVYSSGTDELGDFKIGYFAKVENRTGNITFGGTVEISEVSFLKISGGDITIEGFSADNTLGGIESVNELLPTQKAVKDFITNNLGNFINKTYSTNPTPRALVELGDNGRINIDQIPALRPFNVFTVADQAERLALEGALAGDIAIQQDISLSFILNNDSEFQVLEIAPNAEYSFSNGDVITASPSTSQGTITSYIKGYIDTLFISDPGSNYTAPPSVFIGTSASSKISQRVYSDEQVANNSNLYTITNATTLQSGVAIPPTHTTGVVISDDVEYTFVDSSEWAVGISLAIDDIVYNSSGEVYKVTAVDTATTAGNEPTHTGLRQNLTLSDSFAYEYIGTVWSSTGTHGYGVTLKYYSHLDAVSSNVNVYTTRATAISSTTQPSHTSGSTTHGDVTYLYVGDQATATATIANNRLASLELTDVGSGYNSDPIIVFTNDPGDSTGSGASATTTARSRIAITIENNIKVNSGDTITDFTVSLGNNQPFTVTITDAVNTSAQNVNNWVQLTSSNIDASFITTGTISTARLGIADTNFPANSNSFLRGDQKYTPVTQFLRVADNDTPILLGSQFSRGSYIEQVYIKDGGSEYQTGTYSDSVLLGAQSGAGNPNAGSSGATANFIIADGVVQKIDVTNGGGGYLKPPTVSFEDSLGAPVNGPRAISEISAGVVTEVYILDGGNGIAQGLQVIFTSVGGAGASATATATVSDGVVARVTITDGGVGYDTDFDVSPLPSSITVLQGGTGDDADLLAKLATRQLNFGTVDVDIKRLSGNTVAADNFSTVGVVRVWKEQFDFFSDGGIQIKEGSGVGLDADKLDGQEGLYYQNGANFIDGSVGPTKLESGEDYEINITGSAGSAGILEIVDTKTVNTQPQAIPEGAQYAYKNNLTVTSIPETNLKYQFLDDGGTQHQNLTFRRPRSSATDFSSGAVNGLAFSDNNNLFIRGTGGNFVSALTLSDGGNGYIQGTYEDVPLGGGEGSGLKATIVVNNTGNVSSVTMTDSGNGYNESGSASGTFVVILPESYFGLDNGRTRYTHWEANVNYSFNDIIYVGNTDARGFIYQVTLAGSSGTNSNDPPQHESGAATTTGGTAEFTFIGYTNARIVATIASTATGNWNTYKKMWSAGNDGPFSGLNADQLDDRELSWVSNALNINSGTLSNRRLPDHLSQKDFNNRIRVTSPNPDSQTINKGLFYDLYLEGFANTTELDELNTQIAAGEVRLNLYTVTNVNQGTISVINYTVNTEESDFYWGENAAYVNDRLIQYGYNIYRSTAVISNSGTTPPNHVGGTVSNLEFVGKVTNPWTIVTAELVSGVLDENIVKLGNAVRPATYYNISDWSITKNSDYSISKHNLTVDNTGNPFYLLGNQSQITSPSIRFLSSGNTFTDVFGYDVAMTVTGGSATNGTGNMNIDCTELQVDGQAVWHAGNVQFIPGIFYPAAWVASALYSEGDRVSVDQDKIYTITSSGAGQTAGLTAPTHLSGTVTIDGIDYTYTDPDSYDTNANSKGVLRDAGGNVSFNTVIASLRGAASLNVLKSGDTMSGDLQFNQSNTGVKWTMNSDGAGIFFKNDGDTDTNSYLEYYTQDNGDEYHVWTVYTPAESRRELMRLEQTLVDPDGPGGAAPTHQGNEQAKLTLSGYFEFSANSESTITTAGTRITLLADSTLDNSFDSKLILAKNNDADYPGQVRLHISENDSAYFFVGREASGAAVSQLMQINKDGDTVIGEGAPTSSYKLKVEGTLAATSKSFVIDHPTKENYHLVYGSLEGPEHGVYVRGKTRDDIVELPEYWTELVDANSITVQLTPIGNHNSWVDRIEDNKVYIGGGASFYFIQAERKDIDKLQTEVELTEE